MGGKIKEQSKVYENYAVRPQRDRGQAKIVQQHHDTETTGKRLHGMEETLRTE